MLCTPPLSSISRPQQFGQPIGRFQRWQHAVDMLNHLEQRRSMRCSPHPASIRRTCGARKAVARRKMIGRAGRYVGSRDQLHGGMGMTTNSRQPLLQRLTRSTFFSASGVSASAIRTMKEDHRRRNSRHRVNPGQNLNYLTHTNKQ